MSTPNLQVIAATPGPTTLRRILDKKRVDGQLIVTAFSSSRLRALKEVAGDDAESMEILEFGAVVGNFLGLAGVAAGGLPSRGHVESAVSLACESLPEDSPFTRSALTAGFQDAVIRALDLLRDYGIEAPQLEELAATAPEALASKLSSLAAIQRSSAEMLERLGKRFNAERIRQCLEIGEPLPFKGALLVVAGTDDDPMNLEWIRWAAALGVDVTVVVEAHPTEPALFEGGRLAAKALGADDPSPIRHANTLTASLFASTKFDGTPAPLEVEVKSMPDALSECEWTIRHALELIDGGVQPESLAIVARRMEEYAPLLEASAKRLGVPLSVTRTTPLMASGITCFLLDLLESLADQTPTRLERVLRRTYFNLSATDLAALATGFHDVRIALSDPWDALRLFAERVQESYPWLHDLLKWRHTATAEPRPLASWLDLLRELGELPWLGNAFASDYATSTRDHYAMNVLQRCIAEVASLERVARYAPTTLSGFVRRCRERWSRAEVSVPRLPGGVALVSSGEEIGVADTVYVVGLLEGVFPRRRSEDPILSDEELQWISSARGILLPDSHRRARAERDEFYRVCSAPARKLILSYPQAGDDRDNVSAFYLKQVELIVDTPMVQVPRSRLVPELPVAEADKVLAAALEAPRAEPLALELKTDVAKAALRRQPKEQFRSSDLRRVLDCPFLYMASTRLKIRSNRQQSRWNRLLSLPMLVALPAAPTEEVAKQTLTDKLNSLLEELQGEATPEDLRLMRIGGERLVREWVEREFEARKIWKREAAEPHPTHGEQLRSTLKPDGNEITLTGQYPGLSNHSGQPVVNLFWGHNPISDWKASTFLEKFKEGDRFELGLVLASQPKFMEGGGLEIDSREGRMLIMTRRPDTTPQTQSGFSYSTLDDEDRRTWMTFVGDQIRKAIQRLDLPAVDATPGDACAFCDVGELCRRAQSFSELGDPFMEDSE